MNFIKEKLFTRKDLLTFLTIPLILWFTVFPEFSITADCCSVVDENGQIVEFEMDDRELAMAVLAAGEDEIVIKSKIWEMITNWNKEAHDERSAN